MATVNNEYINPKDGLAYPRVSNILEKPDLSGWHRHLVCKFGKTAFLEVDRVSKDATDTGTEVHGLIEDFFTTGEKALTPTDPAVRNAYANFLRLVRHFKPEQIFAERTVYYKDGDVLYAGTLDWYGVVLDNGVKKKVLLDWKTSKDIRKKNYVIQAEAYYRALRKEDKKIEIDELWVVRLPKVGCINFKKDIIKVKPSSARFQYFINLASNYQYKESFK